MQFDSLTHLIRALEQQDTWLARRQFQRVGECWSRVVGAAVAAQTRPIALQRQVLQVATSSSAWAQNLMFERQNILEKLNAELPFTITDIRFSNAQWHANKSAEPEGLSDSALLWKQHPSYVEPIADEPQPTRSPNAPDLAEVGDSITAFQHWAATMQARSHHLPLCPACQCPTPQGELERWSVCGLCASQQWSTQTSSPVEPKPGPEET
ncbi:DUF721 domain-containing protein [Leptolyngbya sp. AN02str]|uniref:DUF721 domain-containing protein n=1 Tax=Leptolyngbya sp. AN02str TaxID=3423363 RepID=UPI003D3226C2